MDQKKHAIEAASAFVNMVKKGGVRIRTAFLFGSSISGKMHKDSDIDIALVSPDFSGFRFDDLGLVAKYIIKSDSNLEIHPFTSDNFDRDNAFVEEVVKKGLKIA